MRILIYLLSCVMVFSCSTGKDQLSERSGTISSSDYYKDAMESAKRFEESGFKDKESFRDAVNGFQEVVLVEKLNADAWYNLGRTLYYGTETVRAKDCFRTAIKYRKNFVESYSMLVRILVEENNIDQAAAVAEKEYENIPDSEISMTDLATVYFIDKRYDEAYALCKAAVKRNTKYTPAYIILGNIQYTKARYELARLIYLKAVDQGDESGELYTNMGLVALYTEDKDIALGYFRKGVEKSPNNPYTHLNLGNFLLASGDYEGGIEEFDLALKIAPRMVEAIVGKGSAYMQLKLFDKAESLYKKAISTAPNCAEAYFNYGILILDYRTEKAQAADLFKRFIELKGSNINKDHRVYKYLSELKPVIKNVEKKK